MMRKLAVSLSLVTFYVPFVAAQPGEIVGIVPLLTQLIGVEVSNPSNAIGVAASIGLMTVIVYGILKVGAERLDLGDSLTGGGRDGGRNILAIVSILIVLSTAGTGLFSTLGPLYSSLGLYLLVGIFLVALVGILFFAGGGLGGAAAFGKAGGDKLKAEGQITQDELEAQMKEKRGETEKRKAEAEKRMNELENEADQIRQDIQDGSEGDADSEREAAELEEDVINKIKSILNNLNLENDVKLAEKALNDVEDELQMEKDIGPKIGYASARINRALAYLEVFKEDIIDNIDTGGGGVNPDNLRYADALRQTPASVSGAAADLVFDDSAGWTNSRNRILNRVKGKSSATDKINYPDSLSSVGPDEIGGIEFEERDKVKSDLSGTVDFSNQKYDYGICEAYEDLQKVKAEFTTIGKGVEEEESLEEDAFNDLVQAVEDIKLVHGLVGELHDLLDQLEEDDEMLEKLAEDQDWRDLFEEVESEEEAVEDLDDYLNHLDDLQSKALPILEETYEKLSGFLDYDESEIQRLDNDKTLIGEIVGISIGKNDCLENKFDDIESNVPRPLPPERQASLNELKRISQGIGEICRDDILGELKAVEDIDKREDSEARDMIQELEEIVG
ncbi:hypothetical protein GLT92_01425 [Nanohaloarchaea archaeon]|nr:hypothetical protein [Candidatus Nanohaloarchaea archaeon]NMJ92635.1 hypothetical protein [Candidatus Nanohaloarchaea archaeon]